jgi:hypothetical protein
MKMKIHFLLRPKKKHSGNLTLHDAEKVELLYLATRLYQIRASNGADQFRNNVHGVKFIWQ